MSSSSSFIVGDLDDEEEEDEEDEEDFFCFDSTHPLHEQVFFGTNGTNGTISSLVKRTF